MNIQYTDRKMPRAGFNNRANSVDSTPKDLQTILIDLLKGIEPDKLKEFVDVFQHYQGLRDRFYILGTEELILSAPLLSQFEDDGSSTTTTSLEINNAPTVALHVEGEKYLSFKEMLARQDAIDERLENERRVAEAVEVKRWKFLYGTDED